MIAETRKTLRMNYTGQELADMLNMHYNTFRRHVEHPKRQRYTKRDVLQIFQKLGYPDGYEHYEKHVNYSL